MSDIGLLMTGVLTTGHPSPLNLPEEPTVQLDNQQQLTQDRQANLVPTTQITPPELMLSVGSFLTAPSTLTTIQSKNILKEISSKIQLLGSSSLVKAKVPQTISSEKQNTEKMLVADAPSLMEDSLLPTLRFGNSNLSVKVLQRLLLSNGYTVRVDGFFGALTEAAVKAFQDERSLSTDGVVGDRTWGELAK